MHVRYTAPPRENRNDLHTLRSLLPYLWNYRGRAALALGCLILAKVSTVLVPLILKEVVDALDDPESLIIALPLGLLLGYGALRLAGALFNELRDGVFAKVRQGVVRLISRQILEHLHQLSLRFHLERKTGGVSRDIERGTRAASTLLNFMVFSVLPIMVEFILVGGILLSRFSIWFTVVTFVAVVAYIAFTFAVTNWRIQFRHRMNAMDSQANSQAVDSLINYETVKYFRNEKWELDRYDKSLAEWEDAAVKTQTSLSALNFGQGAIIAVGVTIIMILAADGVAQGDLTLGDLVMVNAFLLQLFIPLGFLGVVYSQLKHALSDMEMMFELLDRRPEIRDREGAQPLRIEGGRIRFERVRFHYNPDRQILHEVDFELSPGIKLAVVGPSGSGKSTLARLLFRFYDVGEGRVLVDDQDVRDVTQASLRDAIGIVPQDTVLFNDSIYYNIQYGCPEASQGEVERAAELAYIHHFIQSLPQGYETVVGERGLKLSGGEKQRVAIARAILKNPRIMVFDEATSSLDSQSEQTIQSALKELAENHTTLVIAHRLSTIVDADQILVMEQGRIVERGTHAELLTLQGSYAAMWDLQQEEQRQAEAAESEAGGLGDVIGSV